MWNQWGFFYMAGGVQNDTATLENSLLSLHKANIDWCDPPSQSWNLPKRSENTRPSRSQDLDLDVHGHFIITKIGKNINIHQQANGSGPGNSTQNVWLQRERRLPPGRNTQISIIVDSPASSRGHPRPHTRLLRGTWAV